VGCLTRHTQVGQRLALRQLVPQQIGQHFARLRQARARQLSDELAASYSGDFSSQIEVQ
jgi:hypothetical protein